MLLLAEHVLTSMGLELKGLQSQMSGGEASALQSFGVALQLLQNRERGDVPRVRRQLDRLDTMLAAALRELPRTSHASQALGDIQRHSGQLRELDNLRELDAGWVELLKRVETMAAGLAGEPGIDAAVRQRLTLAMSAWEAEQLKSLLVPDGDASSTPAGVDDAVTQERLSAYLQDRFRDPHLELVALRPLAGGFGKQTFLFEVRGEKLSGSFVLRRDMGVYMVDNDCHRIQHEYEIVRAVRSRGFPAPEALWVDCEHPLLPGGHFMVMRRSPGVPGGSVFQAQTGVPSDLTQTLAGIVARLHALPAMAELGELTDSIAPQLWTMPLEQRVRQYLQNFRALFERAPHLPSPALMSLFGWLLDNVPPAEGLPVLLHGDIGFHNFLFDDGKLSAVLDWEFAHLGDPAEDLAYVRNTLGEALDWDAFLGAYREAGGASVDARRLHFMQVWGHVRNACAANLVSARFVPGQFNDLKLVLLPHLYMPQFLNAARTLIEKGPR
jgi:aminoglycoside phosphotransferase (APT) family kinase protein